MKNLQDVVIFDKEVTKDVITWGNLRIREINQIYEKENNSQLDQGLDNKVKFNEDDEDPVKHKRRKKNELIWEEAPGKLEPVGSEEFKDDFEIDGKVLDEMERIGFPKKYVRQNLKKDLRNQCTTTYYLLAKDQGVIHQ
jgi:hypothetical protein